jgi:hypothetical protein
VDRDTSSIAARLDPVGNGPPFGTGLGNRGEVDSHNPEPVGNGPPFGMGLGDRGDQDSHNHDHEHEHEHDQDHEHEHERPKPPVIVVKRPAPPRRVVKNVVVLIAVQKKPEEVRVAPPLLGTACPAKKRQGRKRASPAPGVPRGMQIPVCDDQIATACCNKKDYCDWNS